MNDAQRNIITKLGRYDVFSWYQPGDYGDMASIDIWRTVDDNYEDIARIIPHVVCVVIESQGGNDYWSNQVETFSFECRYPVHHYIHSGSYAWQRGDGDYKEFVPFETGEIEKLGLEFAEAFGLPVRYISREESK